MSWFTKSVRDDSAPGLRLALAVGFGGMLLIFLIAGLDSVRLLREMRAGNKLLRDAALERSHRLASIRSYVLLTQAYMGDYLLDVDEERSHEHLLQMEDTWSRMMMDLASYQTSTLEEALLVKRLQTLLDQHWRDLSRAMTWSSAERRRRGTAYFWQQILPLRTAVLEITTRVESVDARQLADAESAIQREFEDMGRQLTVVLEIAVGAGILLAVGCILYILSIGAQSRIPYHQSL